MKKSVILLSLLFLTTFGFGQVVVNPSSPSFGALVSTMQSAEADLYLGHGDTVYNSLVLTYDVIGGTADFYTDSDSIFNDSFISNGNDQYFKTVENPPGFFVNSFVDVGFFGFEAGDVNKLKIDDGNSVQQLFDHVLTPPPSAVQLVGSNDQFSFIHDNPVVGSTYQTNTDRFLFFQEYDPATGDDFSSWIVAIDDREDSLIDFDDGFFYISGDISPVPEPSAIAAIAFAALMGIVVGRRKLKAIKK